MKYRLWTVLVAAAVFAAGVGGGGEGRSVAATAPDVVAIPAQPLPGLVAEPEDDRPPRLKIHGNVVDIESGRPITDFVLQAGSPDPNAPERTIWGSGESHSSPNPEGSLDHTYIEEGEWCRVLAAGYVPQPITEKPYDGRPGTMIVTVKLRRGWRIAGRVLDSSRKPVAGASVFLVGGRMMGPNITGGKAWEWPVRFLWSESKTVSKAVTNRDGRFVLNGVGGYETAIAVSASVLDLWIHEPVPALGKSCEIVLPAPGKLILRYDIEGGEPEATVSLFCEHEHVRTAFNVQHVRVKNGGKCVLENLMPGTYDVERKKTVRVAAVARSLELEPSRVVIADGKTSELALVRNSGSEVQGEVVGLAELKMPGAFISVVRPRSLGLILANNQVHEAIEVLTCDATGRFKTPRLPPGSYVIVAEGYKVPKPEERFDRLRSSVSRAIGEVKVPEHGPAPGFAS